MSTPWHENYGYYEQPGGLSGTDHDERDHTGVPGVGSGGGEHPDLAAHDTLGLATKASLDGYVKATGGGLEGLVTVAAAGTAETINLSQGNVFDITLSSANCDLDLTGATADRACSITIILRQDSTGSRAVTWPASVEWPNDTEPTLNPSPDSYELVSLLTVDAGTTWIGISRAEPATPGGGLWTMSKSGANQSISANTHTKITFDATNHASSAGVVDLASDEFDITDNGYYVMAFNWRWPFDAVPAYNAFVTARVDDAETTYRSVLPATPTEAQGGGHSGIVAIGSLTAGQRVSMWIHSGANASSAQGNASVQLRTTASLMRVA